MTVVVVVVVVVVGVVGGGFSERNTDLFENTLPDALPLADLASCLAFSFTTISESTAPSMNPKTIGLKCR